MGNNLCKVRPDQPPGHTKNPIDRVIGRCVQICPNTFAKQEHHYWQKHVLETMPPKTTYPKPNEWRNATLQVSSDPMNGSTDAPIPPPRRKRSSQIFLDDKPGGFKEVFGNLEQPLQHESEVFQTVFSNQQSVSSEDFADFSKDITDHSTESTDPKALKRRISKVGNKKSDKFFGENLSDCLSDEPIGVNGELMHSSKSPSIQSIDVDKLDIFVEKNLKSNEIVNDPEGSVKIEGTEVIVVPPRKDKSKTQTKHLNLSSVESSPNPSIEYQENKEKSSSLNRRAEFLMTLLEGYQKDEKQSNEVTAKPEVKTEILQAVEESIIVPKRKHVKHLCDDEEKLKSILHPAEKSQKTASEPIVVNGHAESPTKIGKHVNFAIVPYQAKGNVPPEENGETTPDIYANMEPVVETLIVPKRRQNKHICTDDKCLHEILHPATSSPKISTSVTSTSATSTPVSSTSATSTSTTPTSPTFSPIASSSIIATPMPVAPFPPVIDAKISKRNSVELSPPKKPDRDFEKYGKSLESSMEMYATIEKPMRKNRRSISRDSLPNPPPRPEIKSETIIPDYQMSKERRSPVRPLQLPPDIPTKPIKSPLDKSPLTQLNFDFMQPSPPPYHVPSKPPKSPADQDPTPINFDTILPSPPLNIPSINGDDTEPLPDLDILLPTIPKNIPSSNQDNLEGRIKKDNRSPTFLSPDIMDDIVNKVCNFTMTLTDDEHHDDDDGCSKVKPVSKVAKRKISTSRMEREKEETEQKKKISNASLDDTSLGSRSATHDYKVGTEDFLNFERKFSLETRNVPQYKPGRQNVRKAGAVLPPNPEAFQKLNVPLEPFPNSQAENKEVNEKSRIPIEINNRSVEGTISQNESQQSSDAIKLVDKKSEDKSFTQDSGKNIENSESQKIRNESLGDISEMIKVLEINSPKDNISETSDDTSSVVTEINLSLNDEDLKISFTEDGKLESLVNPDQKINFSESNVNESRMTLISSENDSKINPVSSENESYKPIKVCRKGSIIDIDACLLNDNDLISEQNRKDSNDSESDSLFGIVRQISKNEKSEIELKSTEKHLNEKEKNCASTTDHSVLLKFFDDSKK